MNMTLKYLIKDHFQIKLQVLNYLNQLKKFILLELHNKINKQ